jgi:thiol-disulfide isomerase/thioredoxin
MAFNPKQTVLNYFKKKKPLSIFFDVTFVIVIALLLIPATRKETAAFFIRLTSFPASTLDSDEQFKVSNSVNNWQLFNLDGQRVSYTELSDKPLFVNIWATWCPPCVAELPGIEELHQQFGEKVSFILVSNEDPNVIKAFAEKHAYNELPFYYSNSVPPEFSSNSIPTTFILDKNGVVKVNKKGAARWNSDKTEKLLEQLIKE